METFFGGPAAKKSPSALLWAGRAVRAPSAHSLRMQGKQRVDGSGRDVGMMRRAAVEAVEQQLGRPDLAEALGGWLQGVEQHEVSILVQVLEIQ
jgi:hypothetical protein